jgi:hypothetical protein
MAGKLITLPLRVSFVSARLLTRAAGGAAGRALSLAGRSVGASAPPVQPTEQPVTQPPVREPSSVRAVSSVRTPMPEPAPISEAFEAPEEPVIARARSANQAELAAVRLYESRHRSRQTVLAAVDRQLKLSNGGPPA